MKSDREKMVEVLKRDNCIRNFEAVGKSMSGSTFIGDISSEIIDFNEEKCLLTMVRNITDRKKTEEELRHLRNYLANIIDSMPSVVVGVDADGRVTQWNKTAERTTGLAASAAQGKILSDVFPQMASEMEKITENIRTRYG